MKKASVIGHFGLGTSAADGQTIKTKILADELARQFGEDEIKKIDTHGGIKTLFKAPFQVIVAFKVAKNIIMLPAHNGLRIYAPLLVLGKTIFKSRKVHYVVIGGWLPEFLQKRKWLAGFLKKFDGIYVETKSMKHSLDECGFTNVFVMPNFKRLRILSEDELVYPEGEPFKLCTFSRVMKEKGIEDAVDAVRSVNENIGRNVYTLDIYGQVDSSQTEWFDTLRAIFPKYISYNGCIDADKSVEVLKDYFALLFPTYYEGEGFAGTLIDAFSAGIPVIASEWKYNKEIVSNEIGMLYPTGNKEELVNLLLQVANNPQALISLKANCRLKAYEYTPPVVVEKLVENFV